MENDNVQTRKRVDKPSSKEPDHSISTKRQSATIPLLITIIGIFCYLGVVLPSVFDSSTRFFNYSVFDILLMIGGAALVGLGAYFWFKIRTQVLPEDDKKTLEFA
jgi:hypothetical protein